MHARHIFTALVILTALILACCTTVSPRHATYTTWMGQYDVDSVAMLDADNHVLSTRAMLRHATEKAFAEKGHPDMTREAFIHMVDALLDARLRKGDPLQPMYESLLDTMTAGLDGKPYLTLASTSLTTVRPLLTGDSGDDLLTANHVTYRLHDKQGAKTLLARGILHGRPVQLKLYLFGDNRLFIDMLPFIGDRLGDGKRQILVNGGVDKIGVFLTPRHDS